MASERQRLLVLLALVAALLVVLYWFWPQTAAPPQTASNVRGASRAAGSAGQVTAPDVHLRALEAERPKPAAVERNLFRFRPKQAPPPSLRGGGEGPAPVLVPPSGPPSPPPLPPIPLKFIGVVERPEHAIKIAVLSDSRGTYYGREGETVLGQYKILRIGVESIEMSYLDGRGRQTMRLSGS